MLYMQDYIGNFCLTGFLCVTSISEPRLPDKVKSYYPNFYEFEADRFATNADVQR